MIYFNDNTIFFTFVFNVTSLLVDIISLDIVIKDIIQVSPHSIIVLLQ